MPRLAPDLDDSANATHGDFTVVGATVRATTPEGAELTQRTPDQMARFGRERPVAPRRVHADDLAASPSRRAKTTHASPLQAPRRAGGEAHRRRVVLRRVADAAGGEDRQQARAWRGRAALVLGDARPGTNRTSRPAARSARRCRRPRCSGRSSRRDPPISSSTHLRTGSRRRKPNRQRARARTRPDRGSPRPPTSRRERPVEEQRLRKGRAQTWEPPQREVERAVGLLDPRRDRADAVIAIELFDIWALPHRFDRNSTSASNMNSNRGGTARRRRGGSRGCFRACRLAPEARIAAGGVPYFGCLLLEGSALPRAPHPSARHHERRNGRRQRPPPRMASGHIAANAPACPDGDRTGTCQHILLKAAGGEFGKSLRGIAQGFTPIGHCASNRTNFPRPLI